MVEEKQVKLRPAQKPVIFAGKDYLRFITDTLALAQQAMMYREYVQWIRLLSQLHSWTKSYQRDPEVDDSLKKLLTKAYGLETSAIRNNEAVFRSKSLHLEKEIFDIEIKISESIRQLLMQETESEDDELTAEDIAKMMRASGMG